jgi:hypothetical protein
MSPKASAAVIANDYAVIKFANSEIDLQGIANEIQA